MLVNVLNFLEKSYHIISHLVITETLRDNCQAMFVVNSFLSCSLPPFYAEFIFNQFYKCKTCGGISGGLKRWWNNIIWRWWV